MKEETNEMELKERRELNILTLYNNYENLIVNIPSTSVVTVVRM